MENQFYSILKGQLAGSLIGAVTVTPLLIERAMTVQQNTSFSYERDGNKTWKKHPLLPETVTTYEKAKPLLLEREMAVCEKPHSVL